MNILTRYVIKRFSTNLFMTILACIIVFVVLDYVGRLKTFQSVSLLTIGEYYIYVIPYMLSLIFPLGMLLATMFTFGGLAKNLEITAMRAAGISIFRIIWPVVLIGIIFTFANLLMSETILPEANTKKIQIYRTKIKNRRIIQKDVRRNLIFKGKKNIIFLFDEFIISSSKAKGVTLFVHKNNGLKYRIECKEMIFVDNAWECINGSLYSFSKKQTSVTSFKSLKKFPFVIVDKPSDIIKVEKKVEEMDYFELNSYIDNSIRIGAADKAKLNKLKTELYFKFSLPFFSFVVVIFGIALTVKIGQEGFAIVFGVGILVAFLYYFMVQVGLGMGRSGNLPPAIAAWFGNILFGPIGLLMLIKTARTI